MFYIFTSSEFFLLNPWYLQVNPRSTMVHHGSPWFRWFGGGVPGRGAGSADAAAAAFAGPGAPAALRCAAPGGAGCAAGLHRGGREVSLGAMNGDFRGRVGGTSSWPPSREIIGVRKPVQTPEMIQELVVEEHRTRESNGLVVWNFGQTLTSLLH